MVRCVWVFTNEVKSMAEASQSWLRADLATNFALSTAQSNGTEYRVKPRTNGGGDDLEVCSDPLGAPDAIAL
jgi:hypothetical protein